MALGTGIEWTDATWNVLAGCTPVSPGCLNCYAATMARRLEAMGKKEYQPRKVEVHTEDCQECQGTGRDDDTGDCQICRGCMPLGRTIRIAEVKNGRAVFTGEVRCLPERLTEPLHWNRPRMVFVNSMSDLFHEDVPFAFIDRAFAVMALCPQHTFQVLTKRPERMAEYLCNATRQESMQLAAQPMLSGRCGPYDISRWPLPNVWLGTSVEDQARADERIPHLLRCPAAVRFLSCEPLLGPLDLSAFFGGPYVGLPGDKVHDNYNFGIDWVIVGGESGPHAREFGEEWAESIREQCAAAGVPFFFKQYGSNATRGGQSLAFKDRKGADPAEWPEDLRVRKFPEVRR